jgi:hypothetical protein
MHTSRKTRGGNWCYWCPANPELRVHPEEASHQRHQADTEGGSRQQEVDLMSLLRWLLVMLIRSSVSSIYLKCESAVAASGQVSAATSTSTAQRDEHEVYSPAYAHHFQGQQTTKGVACMTSASTTPFVTVRQRCKPTTTALCWPATFDVT